MSQYNTTWKINEHEFKFDAYDLECAEALEKATEILGIEEKKIKYVGTLSEQIKSYTTVFYNYFDNIFGKGSGEKILGKKRSIRICNEVYGDFLDFVAEQKTALNEQRNEIVSKYSNRQQRRAAQKKQANKK